LRVTLLLSNALWPQNNFKSSKFDHVQNQTDFSGLFAPFDLGQKADTNPGDVGKLLLRESLRLSAPADSCAEFGNVSDMLRRVVDSAHLFTVRAKRYLFVA
jgi:hypothetical protein